MTGHSKLVGDTVSTLENGVLGPVFRNLLPKSRHVEGSRVFPVHVDYSKRLEEMISAGRYDCVSTCLKKGDIKRFRASGKGLVTIPVHLVYLCGGKHYEYIREDKAARQIEVLGVYRRATLFETLALGIEYPELQRKVQWPSRPRECCIIGGGSSLDSPIRLTAALGEGVVRLEVGMTPIIGRSLSLMSSSPEAVWSGMTLYAVVPVWL